MTAVADCLRHEHEQGSRNVAALDDLGVCADAVIWYSHQLLSAGKGLGRQSVSSLARLLADSCVYIEQSIVCTVRGQPRLGWASLRLAAEALKDLDAIDRDPALHDLWLQIGACGSSAELKDAQRRFQNRRKSVRASAITDFCRVCMAQASQLGSHPNATSWFSMGPAEESADTVSLPRRLGDPETLCVHMRHLIRHNIQLLAMLSGFRIKHLAKEEAEALTPMFWQAFREVTKVFPDLKVEYRDVQ